MNFWQSSARKGAAVAVALAVAAGCSPKDGAKEFEAAKAAFELADYVHAERNFQKSLECAPDNVDTLVYLARLKLELKEYSAAKAWYDRAAALAGGDCDVMLLGAQIAYRLRDYDEARRLYSELADNAKNAAEHRAEAYAGLGVVEMTAGNFHLARIAFFKATRFNRKCASAWYHLGLLYRDSFGYNEAAIDQFKVYVRIDDLADARVQKVQRTVIPAIEEIVRQNSASIHGASKRDSAAASVALQRAEGAWKKGIYKTARLAYQEALKADPLSFKAAEGLAQAWQRLDATKAGQEKAYECLKHACRLSPSSVKTFVKAGRLATQLGYNSQAVEIYSRALAASPTSFEVLDALVRALRRTGKNAEAKAYQLYRESIPRRK